MAPVPAYDDYWRRMRLRKEYLDIAAVPVKKWWVSDRLNEIERVYFDEMKDVASILEIGSGDNRLQTKFRENGYSGARIETIRALAAALGVDPKALTGDAPKRK